MYRFRSSEFDNLLYSRDETSEFCQRNLQPTSHRARSRSKLRTAVKATMTKPDPDGTAEGLVDDAGTISFSLARPPAQPTIPTKGKNHNIRVSPEVLEA